jgi:hypothetical protein
LSFFFGFGSVCKQRRCAFFFFGARKKNKKMARHEDRRAALVAMVIYAALHLLAGAGVSREDVPDVVILAQFVAEFDASRLMKRAGTREASVPSLALSIVPVAAHGDHGRVFAGLLLLFALGSAAAKLGDGERALYLECVAALLKDACDEFVGAGRRIAETNSTGGWLAVVGVFRKEAEKGKCDERTLKSIFRALDHVQKMVRDEDREREFAAARAALGTVSGAVAFIVEAA